MALVGWEAHKTSLERVLTSHAPAPQRRQKDEDSAVV